MIGSRIRRLWFEASLFRVTCRKSSLAVLGDLLPSLRRSATALATG
jgi:hypothetical protein